MWGTNGVREGSEIGYVTRIELSVERQLARGSAFGYRVTVDRKYTRKTGYVTYATGTATNRFIKLWSKHLLLEFHAR